MGYEVTLTKYAQQDCAELDGALERATQAPDKLKNGVYGESLKGSQQVSVIKPRLSSAQEGGIIAG